MTDKQITIAVCGYTGFIGSSYLQQRGDARFIFIRRDMLYAEHGGLMDLLNGADVVLNLAGFPILKRWTPWNKRKILESRFNVNRNLVQAINAMERKPALFISSSAIGIYDDFQTHDEYRYSQGSGFLSYIVKKWEEPLKQLERPTLAAVLRIGIVLGRNGGAMAPLLRISKAGILPILGSGKQAFSFIHIEDLTAAIDFIIDNRFEGIFNLCSPDPADNATFTKTLAKHTGVRFTFRIPALFLKLGLGRAHSVLTEGQRVMPSRLSEKGFEFKYPDIESAVNNLVLQR